MKLPWFAVTLLSVGMLCGCSSGSKEEAIALDSFKDTYDWRPYHLSQAEPVSADGRFRLVSISENGDLALSDLVSGQSILIRHDQTKDDIVGSKMPMRVTRFDFQRQAADFEWLTNK
jgi:hypothetical protein